jgi:hypothetical protein
LITVSTSGPKSHLFVRENRKQQELLLACWSGTQNGRDILWHCEQFVFNGSSCYYTYSGVCYSGVCYSGVCYSGVCYNERCYKKRMLQRTVFINKIRKLQRIQRITTGRRSTRVRMTCLAFPLWLEHQSSSFFYRLCGSVISLVQKIS